MSFNIYKIPIDINDILSFKTIIVLNSGFIIFNMCFITLTCNVLGIIGIFIIKFLYFSE